MESSNICTRQQAIDILKGLAGYSLEDELFNIVQKVKDTVFNGRTCSLEELKDYFQNIAGVKIDNSILYYKQGVMFSKMDCYDAAIEQFSLAIQDNPNFASAYYNRAACFQRKARRWQLGSQPGLDELLKNYENDLKKAASLGNQNAKNLISQNGLMYD